MTHLFINMEKITILIVKIGNSSHFNLNKIRSPILDSSTCTRYSKIFKFSFIPCINS